jgi:outer membrane lipoprotein-sorting protein
MQKTTRIVVVAVAAAALLEGWALYVLRPSAGQWRSEAIVKDEPAAHALYDSMIASLREADSLSYTCSYGSSGRRDQSYHVWLKKPNFFRVEAVDAGGECTGTLVGDGNDLWIYWPGVCPLINPADTNIPKSQWSSLYKTHRTPLGRHSIGHEVCELGAGHMPFLDPSTFHGYTDSLQEYIDGVASRGTDRLAGQECDVVEVSIMGAQRTWYIWISQADRLPRRIKQVIRAMHDLIGVEEWLDVSVNPEISADQFAWSPPAGWREYIRPDPAAKLLKAGEVAPDFCLQSIDKGQIRLSDFRDKIVWLYIWRSG